MTVATLLSDYLSLFEKEGKPILDLACGHGQNGLYLHEHGLPVHFIDNNAQLLDGLQNEKHSNALHCLNIDLETGKQVLIPHRYQGIIVFRYLHRPLMDQIKAAIEPGGTLIYETFNINNRQFGRPFRDDFLLQENELKEIFHDWHCLHYFEGLKHNPDRAIAQIVCQKPSN